MKLGQDQETKQTQLSEKVVREKILQHNKELEKNIQQVQAAQNQLNLLSQRQVLLQGAIRGLQDLLPKDNNEESFKPNSTGKDGKDVPSTDDTQPGTDEESGTGPEETSGSSE